MTARELDAYGERLAHERRTAVEQAVAAVTAGLGAAGLAFVGGPLAGEFGVGAAGLTLLALFALARWDELVSRLALDPSAYVLPEVSRYGTRAASTRSRLRLAASIASITRERRLGVHVTFLSDRVNAYRADLSALADELAEAEEIEPTAAVACLRLLSPHDGGPLSQPALPSEDVAVAIERVRAGIRRAPPSARVENLRAP